MPEMNTIFVTTQFSGVHCWPNAPEDNRVNSFLRHPHRHIFKVRVEVEVSHNDRQIEFFDLVHSINTFVHRTWARNSPLIAEAYDLRSFSCEQIAKLIGEHVRQAFNPAGRMMVEVSEDGENGARWYQE